MTIASALRASAGTAILQSITITDLAMQDAALEIYFFKADPGTGTYTDDSELDVDDADLLLCIGVVKILTTDWVAAKDNSVAAKANIGLAVAATSGTSLYAVAKTSGAPTYAGTSDLQFTFSFLRD